MLDFLTEVAKAPFNCILWILVGFIAGAAARRIMQAPNYPFIQDVVLGIVGSIVGAFIVGMFAPDLYRTGGLNLVVINIVVGIIGACVLIAIRRMITGRR